MIFILKEFFFEANHLCRIIMFRCVGLFCIPKTIFNMISIISITLKIIVQHKLARIIIILAVFFYIDANF
jgi:hypothetical protein